MGVWGLGFRVKSQSDPTSYLASMLSCIGVGFGGLGLRWRGLGLGFRSKRDVTTTVSTTLAVTIARWRTTQLSTELWFDFVWDGFFYEGCKRGF